MAPANVAPKVVVLVNVAPKDGLVLPNVDLVNVDRLNVVPKNAGRKVARVPKVALVWVDRRKFREPWKNFAAKWVNFVNS